MSDSVGLFAQIQQRTGHATGYIKKREVAHFAGSSAQALRHLSAERKDKLRVLFGNFLEFVVADFRDFTLGFGAYPGAAGILFIEQAHLTEEVPVVERSQERRVGKQK